MKPSNCITPRSLAECNFRPSDDPIERFRRDSRVAEVAFWTVIACGFVAAIAAALFT